MAQLLTSVLSASEGPAACIDTDVLCLVVLVRRPLVFPTLRSLLLSRAAVLAALVASAVELCSADSEAHRRLDMSLVTHRFDRCPAAPATNVHLLHTWSAISSVTLVGTMMTAREEFVARFIAVWDRVLA
jgi:hypothetical protein